ncbi:TPA: hypothetical protein N0F65_004973 [Lagenidium giganteum]|uniref:Tyrosinase copper-binding domain-containing protein n=1 Tax=Lagenidium giganteum TaxID=4803 RepID=A0AAV2ZDU1_9STRA|nr:TPA: hypothetical protein N0F65_004973 [Lagenidium giganteum]
MRLATIIFLAVLGALACLNTVVDAQIRRVRKSWKMFSQDEKRRYLGALQSAMSKGLHYRFAEMHVARPNYDFAHGNCGFVLWHRRFLVAYENMLRDQGPEYASVTLPYWNYFEEHDARLNERSSCQTFNDCSQFLKDFGGSSGTSKRVVVSTAGSIGGKCSEQTLGKYSCASTQGTQDPNCAKCLLRGNWDDPQTYLAITKAEIEGALSQVRRGLPNRGTRSPHEILSRSMEGNFHADVHNKLAGVMQTGVSAFDPVFYGHHTMIDLTAYVHNRCHLKSDDPNVRMQFDVFDQCIVTLKQENNRQVTITPSSKVVIQYDGKPAEEDPVIGKYFKNIGDRYSNFANAESIPGPNAYTYQLDEYMRTLLQSQNFVCPPEIFARTPPKRKLMEGEDLDSTDETREHVHRDDEDWEHMSNGVQMVVAYEDCSADVRAKNPNATSLEVQMQMALLECEATRQSKGCDFQDYSPEFREAMNLPEEKKPFCYQLQESYRKQEIPLLTSKTCRKRYSKLTGTDLVKAFGDEDIPKHVIRANRLKRRHQYNPDFQSPISPLYEEESNDEPVELVELEDDHNSVHVHVRIHHSDE